ncbi:hypothetical protein MTO96_040966 [Rhipicephalus appendiculatus]
MRRRIPPAGLWSPLRLLELRRRLWLQHRLVIMMTARAKSVAEPSNQQMPIPIRSPLSHRRAASRCEAAGSRPSANITWFLDGMPLDERLSRTRVEGNVTASVLLLPPSERSGRLLECRASNDNLRDHRGVLSRYLAVNESNKPEVSIKLGTGLNASHVTERKDVYMECFRPSRFENHRHQVESRWRGAGRRSDPRHGDHFPVLGDPPDSPRCVANEDLSLSVDEDTAVNLTCHVRADPSERLRYFWLAENGTHGMEATRESHPIQRQQRPLPLVTQSNRLEIIVNASIFDAAFACWAKNAGVNRPTLTCSAGNYTNSSFTLTCFTPFTNVTRMSSTKLGQQQRLRVQVFDAKRGNRSERSLWSMDLGPILVNRLRSATDYLIVVRMPPEASFHMYVRTLGPAQTLVDQGDVHSSTRGGRWTLALSVIVLACSLAVTLTALFAIYGTHVRKKKMKQRKPPDKHCKSDRTSRSREDVDYARVRDHKEYLVSTNSC